MRFFAAANLGSVVPPEFTLVELGCAMLNHRGGRVIFGVEPDARVVGQQLNDHALEEVVQELREIEPPVFPTIERVALNGGREVLVVSVDAGHSRPYSFRGQAFRRVGATNQTLSREEYNRVLLERLHADSRWELQPATGWSVSDLDQEEIRRTLEAGIQAGRIEDPDTRDPLAILRGLGLVKQDVLLRAAVVLFGRSDRLLPDFAQCLLRVARFRGMEKGEFLDNASSTVTPSICSSERSASCWITCRSPVASSPAAWSGSTSRRTRRSHSAKRSRTRSATATTRRAAVPSVSRCTTIAWRSRLPGRCISASHRSRSSSHTSPGLGTR